MATKNIVPRAAHEGQIGTAEKPFLKVIADGVDISRRYSHMMVAESDCLSNVFTPLTAGPIATGTMGSPIPASGQHPGLTSFKTSTSANSGYTVGSAATASMMLAGGESVSIVFEVDATTDTTIAMGYHNSVAVTAPVDGVYLRIVGTTLTGVAMSNSSETDTLDTVTLTQGVWYRATLVLNADATLATFTLFTCADGAPVAWVRNTVASNIPTSAGRYCSPRITGTNANGGAAAITFFTLDWFAYWIDRILVR